MSRFHREDEGSTPSTRTMRKKCYVVCGPESSGNRLIASILVRAGCWGEGSTNQPRLEDIPDVEKAVVIIHHNLLSSFVKLQERGFDVVALMLVREWTANVSSLIKRGFDQDVEMAERRILTTLASNLFDAICYNIPMIVTTYESINNDSLPNLLNKLGLRRDNLNEPLCLLGQEYPNQTYFPSPLEVNKAHYENLLG